MDTQTHPLPLSDYVNEYLGHLADRPRTQRTYRIGLRNFQVFLAEQKNARVKKETRGAKKSQSASTPLLYLADFSESVLVDYNDWLAKYSKFTRNTYLAACMMFISYFISTGILESFSLERARAQLKHTKKDKKSYPIPRVEGALPKIIEYWDRQALPDAEGEKARRQRLTILRARAFVHTLYGSAARLSEVLSLNVKDVARGRKSEAVIQGKGDKERFIFITSDARAALRTYLDERSDQYEPVFISHHIDYGARVDVSVMRQVVYKAAHELGIDVSPHDFRHYRARQMLNQGAPLEAIQEILGHSDIGTTRRVYAHYSKPAIRSIFERTTLSPKEAARVHAENEAAE